METEEYILIRDSIEEILAYLSLHHQNEKPFAIRRKRLEIVKHTPTNLSISEIEECELLYSWIPSKIRIWDVISRELPKSKACINKLIHDKIFKYQPFTDEFGNPKEIPYLDSIYSYEYQCTLGEFLDNYLNEAKSFEFIEEVLTKIFQYFTGLRAAQEITEYAFIPLFGFYMNEEKLDISDDLSIEKITDQDIQYIYSFKDRSFVQENSDTSKLADVEFKLCGKYTYARSTNSGEETAGLIKALSYLKNKFKTAIISLRLVSESKIRPFSLFFREFPVSPFRFRYIYNIKFYHEDFEYYPYPEMFVNKFNFSNDTRISFFNIFNILTKIELKEKVKPLRIGLEKFNQSFSRLTWEDMILDYVTVLDSTLLFNSQTSNFYQLCARCSLLLSDKLGFNVFKFTQGLADLRNEIIHKGRRVEDVFKDDRKKIDNKDYSVREFIETCETLVRAVLTEYITQIDTKHDIGTINSNMEEAYFIIKSKSSNKKS
jgi:hypothetical protein